jgi:hypothetical protein
MLDFLHVIEGLSSDEKRRLLKAAGVPIPAPNEAAAFLVEIEENPDAVIEAKDRREVELFSDEAARLHRVLVSELKDEKRLSAERRRTAAEQQLFGAIEELEHLGGKNSSRVVLFKDRFDPAVYKPRSGEGETYSEFPPGDYYRREWLASQVARALGFDVIPATIVRLGPEGIGSVQDWVFGKSASRSFFWEAVVRQDSLQKLALFDVIVLSFDRHAGNIMILNNNEVAGIDNALAFRIGDERLSQFAPLNKLKNFRLSDELLAPLRDFLDSEPIKDQLKRCFFAALGEDAGNRAFDQMSERIVKIVTGSTLPAVNPFSRQLVWQPSLT